MRPSNARVLRRFNAAYLVSAAAAVMLSACSSSADRFADSKNPSDADPVYTASVPQERVDPAIDERVVARPLAKAPIKTQAPNYASNATNYQATYKQPSYRQYAAPKEVASAEPTVDAPAESEPAHYKPANDQPKVPYKAPGVAAKGGSVEVMPGMTLYSIARANNVSVAEIASANGISPPYAVQTGQHLRIPGVVQARVPQLAPPAHQQIAEAPAAPAPAKLTAGSKVASKGEAHVVKTGETLFSLGRAYKVSPYAIADLNRLPHNTTLRLGQEVKIPGAAGAVIAKAKTSAPAEKETTVAEAEPTPAPTTSAATKTLEKPKAVAKTTDKIPETKTAAAEPAPQPTAEPTPAPAVEESLPGFRWPVKGKVISAYGAKPGGLRNEGINIAVPEGSSVRSAESGVVAYAGNELKGYGNLVLIRHAGGWVTAYAHNKELFVKRGDTVKRGDVIAKAGQTGSVTSPQVHFEVRKGATAMDPIRFLGAATASN